MAYEVQCEPAPTSLPLGPLCSSHTPWNDLPPACQLFGSFYLFRPKCHLYKEVSLDWLNLSPSPAASLLQLLFATLPCFIALSLFNIFSYILSPPLECKLHEGRDVCLIPVLRIVGGVW